jgi:hypothetical protein
MPYIQVKLQITPKQQAQALKGAKIRLSADSIGKGQIVLLHPLNAKKVANAKNGINLELSPGELMQTASYHNMVPPQPEGLSGSGIFDSIWSGLKSTGKWLKDSGVGSALADVAQTVATPFVGADIANAGRQILKSTTGVGLKKKKMGKAGSGLYLGKSTGAGLYL